MNKKTIFTIISIAALIGGIALGYFTDIWNDLPAIALTSLGATGLCITTWNKSAKKDGFVLASIICMVICGIAGAFAEMSEDNLQKLISIISLNIKDKNKIIISKTTTNGKSPEKSI